MSSPVSSSSCSSEWGYELDGFLETESRVLEIVELPPGEYRNELLSVVMGCVGPATLWCVRGGGVSSVWVVFRSHEEVSASG